MWTMCLILIIVEARSSLVLFQGRGKPLEGASLVVGFVKAMARCGVFQRSSVKSLLLI